MPDLQLHVSGTAHRGWTSCTILRSMEHFTHSIELELSERWAGQDERRVIKNGESYELWIGDSKISSGYIDRVSPSYDKITHLLSVEARSKTADLLDCSYDLSSLKQYFKQKPLSLAKKVAKPFGVDVLSDVTLDDTLTVSTYDTGETVAEFLDKICRAQGVMMMPDAEGNLVFTRASQQRLDARLVLGENILKAKGSFDMRERFSVYSVVSQGGWTSDDNVRHFTGKAEDVEMRYRPTIINTDGANDDKQIQRQAEWKRNQSYGRSRHVVYTVAGWEHAPGKLWEPNRLITINDPFMAIDEDWLIVSVEFELGENGSLSHIKVMPPEAFELIPLPVTGEQPW